MPYFIFKGSKRWEIKDFVPSKQMTTISSDDGSAKLLNCFSDSVDAS